LVACTESNAAVPIKSFETAVEMLNNGRTAAEIYALLLKVPRFKALLTKTAPKSMFVVPTAPKSVLQKRQAEKKEEMKNPSPAKIQKQSSLNF
jgi:hypothetical protein